jgi:putative ABC transport system permease protein
MAINFVKLSLRNMRKNRLFTLINVGGLALGLAVVSLISLHLDRERSYDQFHVAKDRLVRLTMEYSSEGEVSEAAVTGTKPGPQFARVFPEVKKYCRTFIGSQVVRKDELMQQEKAVLFADSSFFDMFTFPVIAGDKRKAIGGLNQIAISQSAASRYFGAEDPLGKILKVGKVDYIVNAVFEDVPAASQMHFDFVVRFENIFAEGKVREDWWTANWITYLELADAKSIASLETRINEYMQQPQQRTESRREGNDYLKYHLEPIAKVHLHSKLAGFEPAGNKTAVYLFAVVAVLILLMACVNYTNLATAQTLARTSEMGMRRAIGASRTQLFWQFIGESVVTASIAGVLSIVFAILLLPSLTSITGSEFEIAELLQPGRILLLVLLIAVVALVAGAYPAWLVGRMSRGASVRTIVQGDGKTGFLRNGLIVVQFGVSVFLIVYTSVILQQMEFLRSKNLGYDRDHVIILPVDGAIKKNYKAFTDAVANSPHVLSVTGAYETPEFIEWSDGVTAVDEKGTHQVSLNALPVDLSFIKTMNMKLLAGRDFLESDFSLMDTSNQGEHFQQPYLINEALARKLGWTNEEAIGRRISRGYEGPVMGVVSDFHFESLHEQVKPLVMFLSRDLVQNLLVRIDGNSMEAALTSLAGIWKERVSHRPFTYKFLDDEYNALYAAEQKSARMFRAASMIAIVLGCLGLFGIAAYSVGRRRKEVGIRRVLGANTFQVALLLTRKFMLLVSVAILLAMPLAWFAGTDWLNQFAFRIHLDIWLLVLVAAGVLLLSFLTVAAQAVQGALVNPVKSLRDS